MKLKSQEEKEKSIKKLKQLNHYFFQFNKRTAPQILYDLAEHPLALKVFAVIMHCSNKLGVVALKQKYIQQWVNRSHSSVSKAIHHLKKLGIINVGKIDVRNVYIMNPAFIWQDKSNKKHAITNKVDFNDTKAIRNNKKIAKVFTSLRELAHPLSPDELKYLKMK